MLEGLALELWVAANCELRWLLITVTAVGLSDVNTCVDSEVSALFDI